MVMVHVKAIFQNKEWDLQVDVEESVTLLGFQLMSLTGIDVDEQQLFIEGYGRVSSMNESRVSSFLSLKQEDRIFVEIRNTEEKSQPSSFSLSTCTKHFYGNAILLQPGYLSSGQFPVCHACMVHCWKDQQQLPYTRQMALKDPNEAFITDLLVIHGTVDVQPPNGYTKLPFDLHGSIGGDYQYLCYKKGGRSIVTHIDFDEVQQQQQQQQEPKETLFSTWITCSGIPLTIRFQQRRFKRSMEYGVSDLILVGRDENPFHSIPKKEVSRDTWIKKSLLYFDVYYQLSPIEGFSCTCSNCNNKNMNKNINKNNDNIHNINNTNMNNNVVLLNDTLNKNENQIEMAFVQQKTHPILESLREAYEKLQRKEQTKRCAEGIPRLQSVLHSNINSVKKYESRELQEKAKRCIPLDVIHQRAQSNPQSLASSKDEILKQLLHWFKTEFFSWTSNPKCSFCSSSNTTAMGMTNPTTEEALHQCQRVEVYQCQECQSMTRFPRYNDPGKLLETRNGRCGEYANCFTLCCRAMGYDARYIWDITDHVWTEVYSEHFKRWLHCDPCEDQLDCPLTYEGGWGKKLSYVFAFSKEEVVDVTKRYTCHWDDVLERRDLVTEEWLANYIGQLDQALQMENMNFNQLSPIYWQRKQQEQEELSRCGGTTSLKPNENQGRTSGSQEWKDSRGESGKQTTSEPCSTKPQTNPSLTLTTKGVTDMQQTISSIFKQLTKGCNHSSCSNPYCASYHSPLLPNEAAALALDIVIKGSASSVLCAEPGSLTSKIFQSSPLLYWRCQEDMGSNVLLNAVNHHHQENNAVNHQNNAVNHQNNAVNHGCCMHRPFPLVKEKENVGIQLNGSCIGELLDPLVEFSVEFFFRLDVPVKEKTRFLSMESHENLLYVAMDPNGQLEVSWDNGKRGGFVFPHSIELQTPYSVAILVSSHGQLAFAVNGVSVTMDDSKKEQLSESMSVRLRGNDHPQQQHQDFLFDSLKICLGSKTNKACQAMSICHFAVYDRILEDEILMDHAGHVHFPKKLLMSQFYGGSGETTFSDQDFFAAQNESGYRVQRINGWASNYWNGFQFVYQNEKGEVVEGPLHQGQAVQNDPTHQSFELMEGECLVHVSGRKGAWMDQITFHTNFGRKFGLGGSGGGEFSLTGMDQVHEIRALCGTVSHHVDNFAVCYGISPIITMGTFFLKLKDVQKQKGRDAVECMAKGVLRYLDNLIAHPSEEKYRLIKCTNVFYETKIQPNCGEDVLKLIGFVLREDQTLRLAFAKDSTKEMYFFWESHYQIKGFVSQLQ